MGKMTPGDCKTLALVSEWVTPGNRRDWSWCKSKRSFNNNEAPGQHVSHPRDRGVEHETQKSDGYRDKARGFWRGYIQLAHLNIAVRTKQKEYVLEVRGLSGSGGWPWVSWGEMSSCQTSHESVPLTQAGSCIPFLYGLSVLPGQCFLCSFIFMAC